MENIGGVKPHLSHVANEYGEYWRCSHPTPVNGRYGAFGWTPTEAYEAWRSSRWDHFRNTAVWPR